MDLFRQTIDEQFD